VFLGRGVIAPGNRAGAAVQRKGPLGLVLVHAANLHQLARKSRQGRGKRLKELIGQLAQRRVFRATAIYAATVWVVLQAADILAGEGIVSERLVQWLIIASVIGLPLVLLGSWFIEAPWRAGSKIGTFGDLFIIAAITAGAGLFAWQQWFISGTHGPIAVAKIEATDLQGETEALATHLESRFA
jgi:hypothetical protein